ncbi:MAG: hypothetical protein FJX36_03470 [Alphaproteobacteria bacterium]|nr:hypothetical protein [Alphaproteobacteria bacterium]
MDGREPQAALAKDYVLDPDRWVPRQAQVDRSGERELAPRGLARLVLDQGSDLLEIHRLKRDPAPDADHRHQGDDQPHDPIDDLYT